MSNKAQRLCHIAQNCADLSLLLAAPSTESVEMARSLLHIVAGELRDTAAEWTGMVDRQRVLAREAQAATPKRAIGYLAKGQTPVICHMDTQMAVWAARKGYKVLYADI